MWVASKGGGQVTRVSLSYSGAKKLPEFLQYHGMQFPTLAKRCIFSRETMFERPLEKKGEIYRVQFIHANRKAKAKEKQRKNKAKRFHRPRHKITTPTFFFRHGQFLGILLAKLRSNDRRHRSLIRRQKMIFHATARQSPHRKLNPAGTNQQQPLTIDEHTVAHVLQVMNT
jgi:hypothetical protein